MNNWIPGVYHTDPLINALLNVAAEIHFHAHAVEDLENVVRSSGQSLAEALEMVAEKQSGSR